MTRLSDGQFWVLGILAGLTLWAAISVPASIWVGRRLARLGADLVAPAPSAAHGQDTSVAAGAERYLREVGHG